MKLYRFIIIILLSVISFQFITAETNVATSYFMEEISNRNNMNPALAPSCKYYFDFIVLPNFYLDFGINNIILKDLIYNKNGATTSILNSREDLNNFYAKLKPATTLNLNFAINILSFGWRINKHYFLIDAGLQADASASVPKDLFNIAFFGTPDENGINKFNLNKIGLDLSLYSNVSLGYSCNINKHWAVGVKANFLMGYANIATKVNKLDLNASRQEWQLETDAHINASLPITYESTAEGGIDFNSIGLVPTDELISLLYKPAGYGASFDLGLTYKPIKNLTFSAAVTDLGFIHWNKNIISGSMKGSHTLDNLIEINVGDSIDPSVIVDNLENVGNAILGTIRTNNEQNSYTSMIRGNFTAGVEYGVVNNKISFGLLNQMKFYNKQILDELTLAVNFRPAAWFKTSISYSFLNGRWGNLGLGLNLNAGALNMFIIADYIPITWAYINDSGTQIPAPYRTQRVNLQAGFCLNIGRDAYDKDKDGVNKFKDDCPETDMDFLRKQCPGLKRRQYVDKHGCEYDEDKDGIHDCYDQCPNTPFGVEVDSVGCPLDSDRDSVPDYIDQCPNTPTGIAVNEYGCPTDTDRDGIADYLDKCPNTPANVIVDQNGCPVDTDNDGVADYIDKCPNTPQNVEVDYYGCPTDTDRDGVADYIDKCPNTPSNTPVDANGCPLDSDGDGILDIYDECPEVPGSANNNGCPEVKKEVRNLFKKALNGIQFESGNAIIKQASYPILDEIVGVLEENKEYNLIIKGHTDNAGDDNKNLQLSKDRANSVMEYLINKGVDHNRLKSEGYGETEPIADNATAKGRALNRRVELEVQFETITYESIPNTEIQ